MGLGWVWRQPGVGHKPSHVKSSRVTLQRAYRSPADRLHPLYIPRDSSARVPVTHDPELGRVLTTLRDKGSTDNDGVHTPHSHSDDHLLHLPDARSPPRAGRPLGMMRPSRCRAGIASAIPCLASSLTSASHGSRRLPQAGAADLVLWLSAVLQSRTQAPGSRGLLLHLEVVEGRPRWRLGRSFIPG